MWMRKHDYTANQKKMTIHPPYDEKLEAMRNNQRIVTIHIYKPWHLRRTS
jgi:hypothetical protein